MKQILAFLLCLTCSLAADKISPDDDLSIAPLKNGVEVWIRPHPVPSRTISCRVIARHPLEAVPQIFSLNCPVDAFEEELPGFVEDCQKEILNEDQCKIAVIVVGDFKKDELHDFLADAFEAFSDRMPTLDAQIVSVIPSNDSGQICVSLSYPTSFQEIKTDQDLKELWVLYLLQSIVEEKFRKTVKEGEGQWIQPSHAKYMLPYPNTIGRIKQMAGQDPLAGLKGFLGAMTRLKSGGFSGQELSDAKAKLQKNLLNFYQDKPTSSVLADYLASHCSFGTGSPPYSTFMTMSFKAIADVQDVDIAEFIKLYFKDATRRVLVAVPAGVEVSKDSISNLLVSNKTDDLKLVMPTGGEDINSAYKRLPLTDAEAKMIYQIIDTVGNLGLIELYKKENEVTDLGVKVQHVHPFKFLEVVLTNPHLKQSMTLLEGSYFKWRGFFDGSGKSAGFTAKCEREASRDNLDPYIVGFCQAVKANPEQVRYFVEKKEWEKLVRFLIKLES